MIQITIIMAKSAFVAWGVAARVRYRAKALRLVQAPNHRSSHVQPTANGGGLEHSGCGQRRRSLFGIYWSDRIG